MEFPIIILVFMVLASLTRVFTVFLHEIGHAIAGLVLFKGGITIYVGSYGDPKKGVHFSIGRLNIHFKYNPLLWNHGLCTSSVSHMSFWQGYIFTLAGPLTSLIIALVSIFLLFHPEIHGVLKLISMFFLFSSIPDFFQNIIPNEKPIMLYDGSLTYNDGQTLKMLKEYRNVYKEMTVLGQFYLKNEIEKGLSYFEEVYSSNHEPNILRMGIAFNIKAGNYEKAIEQFDDLNEINADDYVNYALAHSYTGQHKEALALYNKSLELNPKGFYALNNRGYTLNILEQYEEAILDFNQAIELNPSFAYAYNNRGLSKIKLGNIEEGLSDIDKSMNLDNQNSYAYKNLGIYYKDIGDFHQALNHFQQAYDYDPKTDGLKQLIFETENQIQQNDK